MKNSVRVVTGEYRGRELLVPEAGTHPMGAREKLALFNMLSEVLTGAVVLDAFAGSGALGIEALGRGAKNVVFLEKSPAAARVIRENLKKLGVLEKTEVVVTDAKKSRLEMVQGANLGAISTSDAAATSKRAFTAESFDLILADPPYDDFQPESVAKLTHFLKEQGILALSHPGEAPELPGLSLQKSRKYAGATISIYEKLA